MSSHNTATSAPTIGILGLGRMGGAIARRLVHNPSPDAWTVLGFDVDERSQEAFVRAGGTLAPSAERLVASSNVLVIAIKPSDVTSLGSMVRTVRPTTLVVSVAAGVPLSALQGAFGPRVVRTMPNVAAEIGRSVTAACAPSSLDVGDVNCVHAILAAFGDVVWLSDEALMHPFTALAGSGPAFVAVFAEALADGAVAEGLSRSESERIVAAMIAGTGALLATRSVDEGLSIGSLKDAVCSPAGTTVAGVVALEEGGARAAAIRAIRAASARSRSMATAPSKGDT